MNLHAFMECSLVNGPGRRSVVWFQGCELRCPECWNPGTHAPLAGVRRTTASDLASQILEAQSHYGIEGITFSGGEPIHQIGAMEEVLRILQHVAPDLSAGLFSGYTEGELVQGKFETYEASDDHCRRDAWKVLRGLLDFAVLGRFNQQQPSSAPLISSRNQELHLLSARYAPYDFDEQRVEVTIGSDGMTQITGFPTLGILN